MAYDFRSDAILDGAYRYWLAKRGARRMPCRQDIDPREVVPLLPNLQITELVDGGGRIRYRLIGTAIVATYGTELTGKYLDEAFTGDRLHDHEENYRMLCREKCPVLVSSRYLSRKAIELVCNRLIMPLSEDDDIVNQALTAMSFQSANTTTQRNSDWLDAPARFDVLDCERTVVR
jgi:hypothetical protein